MDTQQFLMICYWQHLQRHTRPQGHNCILQQGSPPHHEAAPHGKNLPQEVSGLLFAGAAKCDELFSLRCWQRCTVCAQLRDACDAAKCKQTCKFYVM